jgi:deferrochelatase/peroxidase EfeB
LLNPDFRDILSVFSAEGVEFLLVGAYALAVHGMPRATGDIDLWIRCSPENAERVMRALRSFGASLGDVFAVEWDHSLR